MSENHASNKTWNGARTIGLAIVVALLLAIAAVPAAATTLDVGYTLEGCNLDHGATINTSTHICSLNGYTTGNLGKSWAELDKVPFRVTLSNNSGSTATGNFIVAGDYIKAAGDDTAIPPKIGWDQISPLALATTADSGCPGVTSGAQTITAANGGVGGANRTIYRMINASIPAHKTCVYDYTMRLALGAHTFSGSSLQGNLWNENLESGTVGQKRVSIPVQEIAPQEFGKSMSASRGSSVAWSIEKDSDTGTVDFLNTCDTSAARTSAAITVTVSWEKITTVGNETTILTTYTLHNPAHLTAVATVNDTIYEGTTQSVVVDTITPLTFTLVPDETESQTVTTSTTNTSDHFNDVASATYTIDGEAVPGSLPATADSAVDTNPPDSGDTAVISDTETMSPNNVGIAFRVTAVSDATGTFTPAYTPGAAAPAVTSLTWTSASQSDSGSVVFTKRVVLTQSGAFEASATLSDTATVSPDGQTASSTDPVDTDITVSAIVSITVSKTIDVVLGASDGAETFTFKLYNGGLPNALDAADLVDTQTVTFNVGDGAGAKTATFANLDPGATYTVHEVPSSYGYGPTLDQEVTVTLPSCSETATFANQHGPASAQVRKVTDPPGNEAGWVFDLRSGNASGTVIDTVTTTDANFIAFSGAGAALEEGSYTITEHAQTDWDQIGSRGCSFTVNMPADADRVFSCSIVNRQRGSIHLVKLFQGATPTGTQSFSFDLRTGASSGVAGTVVESATLNSGNSWTYDFLHLVQGTYQLCENGIPAGGHSSLEADANHFSPTADNSTICVPVVVGAGDTVNVTVDNSPPPGGNARTIGYWKNWSSCKTSNGKQAPVLDQTLYLTNPDGLTIGILTLHGGTTPDVSPDCAKAVSILNKTPIGGAKKFANDPLFNMAAQLLAAKLNIVAGAASCPAANTAIASGQALLVKYSWNGSSYTGTLSQADKLLANSLNGALDSYNNNTLC